MRPLSEVIKDKKPEDHLQLGEDTDKDPETEGAALLQTFRRVTLFFRGLANAHTVDKDGEPLDESIDDNPDPSTEQHLNDE